MEEGVFWLVRFFYNKISRKVLFVSAAFLRSTTLLLRRLLARYVWAFPLEYGPVVADANDVLLIGRNSKSRHFSAVTGTDVRHFALVVEPYLETRTSRATDRQKTSSL